MAGVPGPLGVPRAGRMVVPQLAAVDPTALTGLEFRTLPMAAQEFWVDDVAFYCNGG